MSRHQKHETRKLLRVCLLYALLCAGGWCFCGHTFYSHHPRLEAHTPACFTLQGIVRAVGAEVDRIEAEIQVMRAMGRLCGG